MNKTDKLHKILNDNKSGSYELASAFNLFVKRNWHDLELIKYSLHEIEKKLSGFAIINNYVKKMRKVLSNEDASAVRQFAVNFEEESAARFDNLYKNARQFLKNINTVYTISNSKTIFELFKSLKEDNKKLKVIISESRPQNEGRILAKKLIKLNIETLVITDALAAKYIKTVDAVILGADKILKSGNTINKTGSLNAALIAGYFRKPVFVAATKDKFTRQIKYTPEEYNSAEVWNYYANHLTVKNYYFEEIPASLIAGIITN